MCAENLCYDFKESNVCKDGEWTHEFETTGDFLEDPSVICDNCGLFIPMLLKSDTGCVVGIHVQAESS